MNEILYIRDYSLFTPRDFDISPDFRDIKPEVENGFDHRMLTWADRTGVLKLNNSEDL